MLHNGLLTTQKDWMKVKGYFVTTDIETAFDSFDHTYLISAT